MPSRSALTAHPAPPLQHDYSILSPTAAATQIAYTTADPSNRWYIPAHNYQRTFASANGAVSLQVVSIDSTPLHDRYLYSGASGGSYATPASGVADKLVNNVAGNAVINPGVTAANGFTNGNYFNASNWQCYYSFAVTASNGFNTYTGAKAYPGVTATGYDYTTTANGWASVPSGNFSKASSGCKYASPEIAPLATPAARAAIAAEPALLETALGGGDDYELLVALPPESAAAFVARATAGGVNVTRLGAARAGTDAARFLRGDDPDFSIVRGSFSHF